MTQGQLSRIWVVAGAAMLGFLMAGAAYGQAPKPAADPKIPPLTKAVTVLTKEYAQFLKNPSANKLRTRSDYFADAFGNSSDVPDDLKPDLVIAMMERFSSPDPTEEAYVKWQLLSGIRMRLNDKDKLTPRLFSLYQRSPKPLQRPGATLSEQNQLNPLIKQRDYRTSNQFRQWEASVARYEACSGPILKYRELLLSRLPQTLATFAMGLQDLQERRLSCSESTGEFFNALSSAIRAWAVSDATKPEIAQMIGEVNRVMATFKGQPNTFFTKPKGDGSGWDQGWAHIDDKAVKKLLDELAKAGQSAGIQIRDPKSRGN